MASSSIGNMNGKWAVMFKLALAVFPIVCGVLSGSVKYVYDHELRIRYIENTRLSADDVKAVRNDISNAKHDITAIESRMDRLESKIDKLIDLAMQHNKR